MYSVTVSHRGSSTKLSVPDRSPAALLTKLRELVGEESRIRVICKGRTVDLDGDEVSLPDGAKLLVVAAQGEAIAAEQQRVADDRRREEIVRTRVTAKPRSTTTAGQSSRFHSINPFAEGPSTPLLERRRQMLERLANDPAIREIMDENGFTVGELTELHPHRDPTLLGLNRNAGESIALRLLTDRLDGLRSYNHVLRVLVHELTHNVHGEHELPFKELDSKLAKQVAAFGERHRGNRLGGEQGAIFQPVTPESERLVSGGCEAVGSKDTLGHRLGSGSTLTDADRKRAAADAAERRSRQS